MTGGAGSDGGRSGRQPSLGVKAIWVLTAGVITVAIAGCSSVSNDPREGGLAGGVNGIVTGSYERRIAEREQAVAELDDANAALAARLDSSKSALRDVNARLDRTSQSLQRMRSDLVRLDGEIRSARAAVYAARSDLTHSDAVGSKMRGELEGLEKRRNALSAMIAELEADHQREAMLYQKQPDGAAVLVASAGQRDSARDDARMKQAEEELRQLTVAVRSLPR